jgi:LPS-assembly protein
MSALVGQSYSLTDEPTILPPGTGLSDRFSDIVGRVTLKYSKWLEVTERFRVDKDSFAIRRNEIDATVGSSKTYLMVGYLKPQPEYRHVDRGSARSRGNPRGWPYPDRALLVSVRFDRDRSDQQRKKIRPRRATAISPSASVSASQYDDECLSLGVTWRRDYDPTGDARRGSTFSLRLALKNVGR